jgi:hypothetical protein
VALLFVATACNASPEPQAARVAARTTARSAVPPTTPIDAPEPARVPLGLGAGGEAPRPTRPDLRRPTEWRAERGLAGAIRARGAEERRGAVVRELFARAGVRFPPRQLFFRAFKLDRELEIWAASEATGPLRRVATYEICATSGDLGPKRREGDLQVPEGFYRIAAFNPESSFHLSMLVDYPNVSDRVLGDRERPGGEIMIHGACVSIGCLAMSDERIEELWVMARALRGSLRVHIFPGRDMAALLATDAHAAHHAFWRELERGRAWFDHRGTLPEVRVDAAGRYSIGD